MATNSDLDALERETGEARARLAATIERLSSPETAAAVKQELTDYAQGLKNQALGYVQKTKDDVVGAGRSKAESLVDQLKQRALANPLGVALIGAGIGWHFYRHPPITKLLVGAGIAALVRGSSRSAASDPLAYRDPYDLARPRGYVPGGVAGYGYPADGPGIGEQVKAAASRTDYLVRDATAKAREKTHEAAARVSDLAATATTTVSDTLHRAGTTISETAHSTAAGISETADSARRTMSDTAESAARSVSDTAGHAARAVSDTVESAGRAISETADRVRTVASDMVERTTSIVGETAKDAVTRTRAAAAQAQSSPVLLGVLGLAAGTALALALRGSDRGDHVPTGPRRELARGGRTRAAGGRGRGRGHERDTADVSSGLASSAREKFGDLAEQAGDIGAGVASSAADAASAAGAGAYRAAASAYRSASDTAYDVGRRVPRTASWLGDELADLGTRYPLLLGALSLAVGAAVGGSMRSSGRENRLMGALSDNLKQRAWEAADEQFGRAKEVAGAFADQLRTQLNPNERTDPSADFETVIGGGKPPADGRAERVTPLPGE